LGAVDDVRCCRHGNGGFAHHFVDIDAVGVTPGGEHLATDVADQQYAVLVGIVALVNHQAVGLAAAQQ